VPPSSSFIPAKSNAAGAAVHGPALPSYFQSG
jgi:hypothetical protein